MQKTDLSCESCGSHSMEIYTVRVGLEYQVCNNCGHCLSEAISKAEGSFEDAQSQYFGEESVLLQVSISPMERETLQVRLSAILSYLDSNSNVIEVGPGAGFLLHELQERGFSVKAVEHSPALAANLRARWGVDVDTNMLENIEIKSESFSSFCSFHVIEHVPDCLSHLQKAYDLVQPGGFAFIATPNARSWQQRWFRSLSPNFDEAHLRVFSEASLRQFCKKAGWEILQAKTPEHMTGWLRVATKVLRRVKREDESVSAGKYSIMAGSKYSRAYNFLRVVTAPFRLMQSRLNGGNELFFVLYKQDTSN